MAPTTAAVKRRRSVIAGIASATVVMAAVVALALLPGINRRAAVSGATRQQGATAGLPAALLQQVENVPAGVLDRVGIAGNASGPAHGDNILSPVRAVRGGPTVASAGLPRIERKPQLFFLGAEFCPYCATLRWSLIVALSRFGTFSGLQPTASTPPDPVVETFTFVHARYSSPYLAYEAVEIENQDRAPLQRPTAPERAILDVWDRAEDVPWFDLAGRYIGGLPSWDDPMALVGLSRAAIAAFLGQPASPVGKMIDAAANYLTAGICNVDGGKPAVVCSSGGVVEAKWQIKVAPAATVLGGT